MTALVIDCFAADSHSPISRSIAAGSILFNTGMMLSLEWENWLRLSVWLAMGLVIYFLNSQKNSIIRKQGA